MFVSTHAALQGQNGEDPASAVLARPCAWKWSSSLAPALSRGNTWTC